MIYSDSKLQKTLNYYIVNTFTQKIFGGNPAGVVNLTEWLHDAVLQNIAAENNLSETAFFIKQKGHYYLRWFSPAQEVPLCGHATLAAAFIISNRTQPGIKKISFKTLRGIITVRLKENRYELDMPMYTPVRIENPPPELRAGLGTVLPDIYRVDQDPNYFVILKFEEVLRNITPRFEILAKLHPYGVAISAPGNQTDYVSRYFAPGYGINEDPVTGSIHSVLTPFWAERMKKSFMHSTQLSKREGKLCCELTGKNVRISGHAVLYLEGKITIPVT